MKRKYLKLQNAHVYMAFVYIATQGNLKNVEIQCMFIVKMVWFMGSTVVGILALHVFCWVVHRFCPHSIATNVQMRR